MIYQSLGPVSAIRVRVVGRRAYITCDGRDDPPEEIIVIEGFPVVIRISAAVAVEREKTDVTSVAITKESDDV